MKVDPDKTPDSYKSLEVVKTYKFDGENRSIDINKTVDDAGNKYYHVVYQPPMEEISTHHDITTLASFTVGSSESVNNVYKHAVKVAKSHYDKKL